MISEEQRETRRQYKHVVSIVHNNTTEKQPPMIHKKHITQIAGYAGIDPQTVRSKLGVAVNNGDLIRDGQRYCTTDTDRVERAIQFVVDQVPVNQDLLGKLNKAKMDQ